MRALTRPTRHRAPRRCVSLLKFYTHPASQPLLTRYPMVQYVDHARSSTRRTRRRRSTSPLHQRVGCPERSCTPASKTQVPAAVWSSKTQGPKRSQEPIFSRLPPAAGGRPTYKELILYNWCASFQDQLVTVPLITEELNFRQTSVSGSENFARTSQKPKTRTRKWRFSSKSQIFGEPSRI